MFRTNVQNFRTTNSQARVLQGEHLRTDEKMLDRLARNAWDSGFVTFKVEDFSKLAIFGDHCGHVVVLKKTKEAKLDVPPILRAILEDPYVTKIGKFTYESKLMLQSACTGLKIRGLYDIRWAFPNIFTDQEELSFSREAKSVDGLRYPHEQPPRGYNPFKNRWEHMEEEWRMSVIQEARLTADLMLTAEKTYGAKLGVTKVENCMEYSRLIFAQWSLYEGLSSSKAPIQRTILEISKWLKVDLYYTLPKDRTWTKSPVE